MKQFLLSTFTFLCSELRARRRPAVLRRLRRRRHRGAVELPAGAADAVLPRQGVVRGVPAAGKRGQEEEEAREEGQEKSGKSKIKIQDPG